MFLINFYLFTNFSLVVHVKFVLTQKVEIFSHEDFKDDRKEVLESCSNSYDKLEDILNFFLNKHTLKK